MMNELVRLGTALRFSKTQIQKQLILRGKLIIASTFDWRCYNCTSWPLLLWNFRFIGVSVSHYSRSIITVWKFDPIALRLRCTSKMFYSIQRKRSCWLAGGIQMYSSGQNVNTPFPEMPDPVLVLGSRSHDHSWVVYLREWCLIPDVLGSFILVDKFKPHSHNWVSAKETGVGVAMHMTSLR